MEAERFGETPPPVADGCRCCPELVANRHRIVHGWGTVPARVMIVGEAPGVKGADRTGVPFTGDRSGRRLQALLIRLGLSLATDPADPAPPLRDCFLSNAVRCNPPGNRRPTRTEIAACAPHLLAELALVRPRLIVAVGGVAAGVLAAHLLGRPLPPIRQAHARPVALPEGRWLLPMLHPSRASNAALDEVAGVLHRELAETLTWEERVQTSEVSGVDLVTERVQERPTRLHNKDSAKTSEV